MTDHKVYRIKLTTEERDTFAQIAKGKRGRLKISASAASLSRLGLQTPDTGKGHEEAVLWFAGSLLDT